MSALTEFRKSKDEFMSGDHQSPLTHDQQHDFGGLTYFDEDPAMQFVLQPEEFGDPVLAEMQTSTGSVAEYLRWGTVTCTTPKGEITLTLFKDPHGAELFLPFADATSGQETYPAGRYIDPHMLPDGRVEVDFNYAYNPYCAYNERWSCP